MHLFSTRRIIATSCFFHVNYEIPPMSLPAVENNNHVRLRVSCEVIVLYCIVVRGINMKVFFWDLTRLVSTFDTQLTNDGRLGRHKTHRQMTLVMWVIKNEQERWRSRASEPATQKLILILLENPPGSSHSSFSSSSWSISSSSILLLTSRFSILLLLLLLFSNHHCCLCA